MKNSDAITVCGADESHQFQPFSSFCPLITKFVVLLSRKKRLTGQFVAILFWFLLSNIIRFITKTYCQNS
jgi:hypothetical protein